MNEELIVVHSIQIQDSIKCKGVTVLTYTIEYPQFSSICFQEKLDKINCYYFINAMQTKKYFTTELCKMAIDDLQYAITNNFQLHVYEGVIKYTITYNKVCIISLYFDSYTYAGGAHGNTIRTSQTWDVQLGEQIQLEELFKRHINYKNYILKHIINEINQNPDNYYSDAEEEVIKKFNPKNYYCTPQGIIIYYQQYDIAPYCSGIQEFLIPYNKRVMNPVKRCCL